MVKKRKNKKKDNKNTNKKDQRKSNNNNIDKKNKIKYSTTKKIKQSIEEQSKIKEKDQSFPNQSKYDLKKSPNLKFKTNIKKYKLDEYLYYRLIDVYAVYTLHKDNIPYLALPNKNYIEIIELINNKKIKSLKNHVEYVSIVEYYINPKNKNKEYLISIDYNNVVFIYDINNSYNILYNFCETYDHLLVNCLLFFPYNSNEDYIITPMHDGDEEGSKVYSFTTCKLIKYIDVDCDNINCILPWYNKLDKKDYIIQIGEEKIFINNVNEDILYSKLKDNENDFNFNGFIYNKNENDYLYVSKGMGKIMIWDLAQKQLIKNFVVGKEKINIIKWNNKYAIGVNNGLKIIDIENEKIVTVIKNEINYIQKLNHPKYGESLIACDKKNISLWAL